MTEVLHAQLPKAADGARFSAATIGEGLDLASAPHPFLSGLHEPMTGELTITDLDVVGTIPEVLEGQYLRIGPNPIRPDEPGHHWFTGDGMVHAIKLHQGRASWYRNRWIRSKRVGAALGEPPAPGPRHGGGDTVNTNVQSIGGRIRALVEAGSYPVSLGDTLDEQRYDPFDGTLKGSFTAHPHRDPLTGEHHAIAYDALVPNRVRHIIISDAGRVVREMDIPVEHGPSIHDCALTARFVVILDLPVTFSMSSAMAGNRFPYRWNPAHRARVGLLRRQGSADDIIWCDVTPSYVFHAANAYDAEDGRVILDVVAYDTMFAASAQGPDATGRLERWTIDPVTRSVERRVIDASAQEFPRPDERRWGQRYRYAYTIALAPDTPHFGGGTKLYKHDLDAGTRQVHEFGSRRHPGEFVFVPAFSDAGEDHGWLVGLVVDVARQTTELTILDASSVEMPPVATVIIPHRVPAGFHGNWIAA